jgi:hypothetical protein
MASAELSRRVGEVVGYPPLSEMDEARRREFHEALLEADTLEDLPGKWAGGGPDGGAEPAGAARREWRLTQPPGAVRLSRGTNPKKRKGRGRFSPPDPSLVWEDQPSLETETGVSGEAVRPVARPRIRARVFEPRQVVAVVHQLTAVDRHAVLPGNERPVGASRSCSTSSRPPTPRRSGPRRPSGL